MNNQPIPGEIYRHRKHDPAGGHWHEYGVVCIVRPGVNPPDSTLGNISGWKHTWSGETYYLYGSNDVRAIPPVDKIHVGYRNTRPESCNPNWVFCLRPLDQFTDGRFTLVSDQ